ncbi:MAG: nitrophenyl compound nitroreductase subunit ArsF family protein [Pseudomonadota bacterium]
MTIKNIITIFLLLFVGLSLIFIILKERTSNEIEVKVIPNEVLKETKEVKMIPSEALKETKEVKIIQSEAFKETKEVKVIPSEAFKETKNELMIDKISFTGVKAYYFHTTIRCKTCKTMEKYINETITTYFSKDIADGKLIFSTLNVDELENKHFIQDYKLNTKSFVLSKLKDDKELKWENLDRIWEFVRNKEEFVKYIKNETEKFLIK